jgi:flagellar basal-body rod protein FlgG
MFDALYIGATGMQAQQLNVDTIANNLANVNTVGFKKGRINFTDLMVNDTSRSTARGIDATSGLLSPLARMGAGVGVASLSKMFDVGDMKQTGSPYDVAIQGDGFFEVVMPDGGRAYTRGGTLKIGLDGQISTLAGYPLKPGITVPENTRSIVVHPDGRVQAMVGNQTTPSELGVLAMVRFSSPQGLLAQGDNLYRSSDASGEASAAKPGEDGVGTLAQGYIEGSNVKLVDEMVNLMIGQRVYEANVKVVQASDDMLGMVNSLRK